MHHFSWISAFRHAIAFCVAAVFVAPAFAEPHKDRCVILVSIDGLANFYFDDHRAHMPTLRRMAAEGARADGMVCSFPTVTWPNHTTLVTGVVPAKHGVIGNAYYDRAKGTNVPFIPDPIFDKDEIVKVPTIYDVAHQAGLRTCGVIWPATRNAKTLDFTVPDMGGPEAWPQFGTRAWLEELRAEGIPVDRHAAWVSDKSGGVQRDWMYTRMAANLLEKHQPNLLLLHLIETDHVQHRVGPRTDDAYWAVAYADERIRELMDAVERSGRREQTTIFICSDHGFYPVLKEIRLNVKLKQLDLLKTASDKITDKIAIARPEGGACAVYIHDDARRSEIIARLKSELATIEGVDKVYTPEQFAEIGQPTLESDPRAADLWLSSKKDYSFSDSAAGDNLIVAKDAQTGTHGYRPDQPDLLATCIIWGAGVKPAAKLGTINNTDIAPTMARVLGVEIPSVDGRALPGIGD
ncbi:MAG: alkaline phosphatase family protein [Planctomycetales bacterium]|nr:alkaline phosphatase family protein [Planctomycetales bacterium]MBN8624209.1 alkaline phosphatase family protein [Planctomycetota bacterium]